MRREKKSRILQEIQGNSNDALRRRRAADFVRRGRSRGWMAGNGREMPKKKLESSERQREPSTTDKAEDGVPENIDVIEWIRNLAGEALGKQGRQMVESLADKATNGDATALRQLLVLAKEMTQKDASMMPGGKTLAQMLAEEPEWQGPPDDAAAEEKSDEPAA